MQREAAQLGGTQASTSAPSSAAQHLIREQEQLQSGVQHQSAPVGTRAKQQAALRVVWPEDRLMWKYFRRHPEARKIPYHLNSFEPPFVKRFALQQLKLMKKGFSESEAFKRVSRDMADEKYKAMRHVV